MARKRRDNRQRIRLSVPRAGPTAPLATFVETTDAACVQRWFHRAVCLRLYQGQRLISLGPPPDLSGLAGGDALIFRVTFYDDLASRLALAALRQMSGKARQVWLLEGALQLLELERRAEQGAGPALFEPTVQATAEPAVAVPRPPTPPQRRTPPPDGPVCPSSPAASPPQAATAPVDADAGEEGGDDVVPIEDLSEVTLGALRGMVAGRRAS